jgi:periplasmic protein TonB
MSTALRARPERMAAAHAEQTGAGMPWERSVYAPPAGHRPIALALTAFLFGLVAAALLVVISRPDLVMTAPAAPLVVNTLPLASPTPEKREKEKPKPEKKQERKEPVPPSVDPLPKPVIALPNPVPAPAPVVQPPAPMLVPKTVDDAAPKAVTAPPAPQVSSNAPDTWQGQVLARLGKYRRYPFGAQSRHEQGVPYIRFVMDRDGKVLSSRLERSSGFSELDREAVALPKRAQPLPKPPADVTGDTIELVVPVEFFMR